MTILKLFMNAYHLLKVVVIDMVFIMPLTVEVLKMGMFLLVIVLIQMGIGRLKLIADGFKHGLGEN